MEEATVDKSGSAAPGRERVWQAFYRILSATRQLPSPPEVCLAVTQAAQDEQTSLADLQRLVESDIALSAKLMQVANSAFFGLRERITSVRRAIVMLGFGTVKTLALGFFFNEEFGELTLKGLPYPNLPRYALASSALAEAVAARLDPELADEAACLGLLHESGTIVMAMAFGQPYRRLLADLPATGLSLQEAEGRAFGVNHAVASQLLLSSWRLDEAGVQAVGRHHETAWTGGDDPRAQTFWKTLCVASAGALLFFAGDRQQRLDQATGLAHRLLDWTPGDLADVLDQVVPAYRGRAGIFDVSTEITEADCRHAAEAVEALRQPVG